METSSDQMDLKPTSEESQIAEEILGLQTKVRAIWRRLADKHAAKPNHSLKMALLSLGETDWRLESAAEWMKSLNKDKE